MASVPPTSPPTVDQVIQWLNELSDRQRLTLKLRLVDGKKQVDAAAVLEISQGQFSANYSTLIGALNIKAKEAGFSYPLSDALLKQALINISTGEKEQTVDKDIDPLKRIKNETEKGKEPPPPAPRNRRLFLGMLLGAVLLFGLLAIAGALRNPFAAATSPGSGPTQTARIETREVTVVVPQTVEVTKDLLVTVLVKETVVVPPTSNVADTQPVPITVTPPPQVSSTGVTVVTTTPLPTDTPIPNPPLEVGVPFANEGAELTLTDYHFETQALWTNWRFVNRTGQQLSFKFGSENITVYDNLGRKIEKAAFMCGNPCPTFEKVLSPEEQVVNVGQGSFRVPIDTNDCKITEITFVARNVTRRIPEARWLVPVKLC